YTGSRNKQAASFKRQVRAALAQLVDVGFLAAFEIKDDLVNVRRAATALRPD
ncbi:MAG: TrfA family protein, partial [Rhodocyclaceae bacterium]|nr:TrfA family protein [Rhodocyclaceae bacterium]